MSQKRGDSRLNPRFKDAIFYRSGQTNDATGIVNWFNIQKG
jgi:hypothetical protein